MGILPTAKQLSFLALDMSKGLMKQDSYPSASWWVDVED